MASVDGKTAPATVDVEKLKKQYPTLQVMSSNLHIESLFGLVRDRATLQKDFVFYADQLLRMVVEEAVSVLPHREKAVVTPTNVEFKGLELSSPVAAVSIMRSGEAMEPALRGVLRNVKIGKILIQRDETCADKRPVLLYSKLPADLVTHSVLLLDPMQASGTTSTAAVDVLVQAGVPPQNISLVSLLTCPEGICTLLTKHPKVRIVTGKIDPGLNEQHLIVPGIGDFGDRYFGTT